MSSTLVDHDLGIQIIDGTGLELDTRSVMDQVMGEHPEMAALVRWSTSIQGGDSTGSSRSRYGNIFDRDRYVTPGTVFEQFKVARDAVESDDVVSGVADTTEALAFNRMAFLVKDANEEDVWNQIATGIDLDSRMREMWRELFVYSQLYGVVWWGQKSFKIRGETDKGLPRRKEYKNLTVPLGLTLLDPLKVAPIGGLLFNQEGLAYIADVLEVDVIDETLAGDPLGDRFVREVILAKYTPSRLEAQDLTEAGVNISHLYRLNPACVFRHTATRPQYQRWATVRMKSVFEILDLKAQLRASDRAHLLGATNFIILIKKGTDDRPATAKELRALKSMVRTVHRVPVIVGDHRLDVEIIEAKLDHVLQPERYNGLNAAITARLYQMFLTGNYAAGASGDDSIKLAKVVARGMESRRHQLRRCLEARIMRPTVDRNAELSTEPKLLFHPNRIELAFDAAVVQFLLDARDRGDLSRETYLAEIAVSQEVEAIRRKREKELGYDDTFTPTNVPFGGGVPGQDPRTAGRNQGGNRRGGGAAPGSGQGQAPRRGRPKDKPKSRPAAAGEVDVGTEDDAGGDEEDS